jgi:restriction system protein
MSYRRVYEIEVRHQGLNKYRLVRGTDWYVVQQKAEAQKLQWDEMWQKRQENEHRKGLRDIAARDKQAKKDLAAERTYAAKEAIEELNSILKYILEVDDEINWDRLKDPSAFNKPKPEKRFPEKPPVLTIKWNQPKESDPKYQPQITVLDKLVPSRRQQKIDESQRLFENDLQRWERELEQTGGVNEQNRKLFEEELVRCNQEYEENHRKWEEERQAFLSQQEEKNKAIDQRRDAYFAGLPGAIVDYCEMVLSFSVYPDYFPRNFEFDYNPETRILIVDYSLPSPQDIPKVKEVKYVQSRDELVEVTLSESEMNKLYDALIYQIALRTHHELYEADVIDAIHSVVFNGWVQFIDKATGSEETSCILSLQTDRAEFLIINLANVDPKACFKSLKGVGSSKLHSLTAIPPVLMIDREDKRFVSSYDVTDSLDHMTNLAALDWEDFEHLIRELFQKEFSQSGGEVRVTQASRDGGVDAIAFDPDPIRGGKIVIQAKRYTNAVGVSAVRDLYGTVLNEGATKGILVTTASYGPDAYEFAKGKPLTLLNGSNLLHLLEKHGHKAKIDLIEAKRLLTEREKAK